MGRYTCRSFRAGSTALFERALYTLVSYLLTPLVIYRLTWRGLRNRGYFGRWPERFGFFGDTRLKSSIWIHAVSVGEFNAAVPLIEALMERHPDEHFVVTTITPTGSQRVRSVFGDRVFHVYLPYDLPGSVRRFLDRLRPRIALVMETEIWPNLYFICHERGIPIVIANARLSERSLRGYGPVRRLAGRAARCCTLIAAQSQADSDRFVRLGARPEQIQVLGNIKYDLTLPDGVTQTGSDLREAWGASRPVWVAASTHEAEEVPTLQAHARVLGRFPDALLLIAPRHPERFRAVITLCRAYGFRTAVRSEDGLAGPDTQVFVIDSMGELLRFYAAADVAFVGGSLEPIGGHNVLEPAALGRPVLVGPYTFNFAEITENLIAAGGAGRAQDGIRLGTEVARILSDPARLRAMGMIGAQVVERERGAVGRIIEATEQVMNTGPQPPAERAAVAGGLGNS